MSSLSELPELIGFFSYSREDDEGAFGALSALRERIQHELRAQLGRTAKAFRIWQDKEAIPSGTMWESQIKISVEQAVFFIPIITPTVIASPYCRFELESFLAREAALGRDDLVFPILYIEVPTLEDAVRRQNDAVLALIARRQYVDWTEFRYLDVTSTEVRRAVGRFCADIRNALYKPWVSPEERKQQQEAAEQEKAEAERQRQAAEAERHATEEARQRKEEAARAALQAKQRAEDEARQHAAEQEKQKREAEAEQRHKDAADAKAREEEEVRLRQSEAEARQRAEGERRAREAEKKQRVDEELRFTAAKRDDTVRALDRFLAAHGESHFATEAKALRAALVEREAAYGGAISSTDPAALKAFLDRYPTGNPAEKVRRRLSRLERGHPLGPARRWLIAACAITPLLVAAFWFFPVSGPRFDGYYEAQGKSDYLRFYSDGTVIYGGYNIVTTPKTSFKSTFTTGFANHTIKFTIVVGATVLHWDGTIGRNSLSLRKIYGSFSSNPDIQEFDFVEYKFP